MAGWGQRRTSQQRPVARRRDPVHMDTDVGSAGHSHRTHGGFPASRCPLCTTTGTDPLQPTHGTNPSAQHRPPTQPTAQTGSSAHRRRREGDVPRAPSQPPGATPSKGQPARPAGPPRCCPRVSPPSPKAAPRLVAPSGDTAAALLPTKPRTAPGSRWAFACSLADGFDEAGREVAHAVVAGPVVVDAALPPPVRVLLQHLQATKARGRGAAPGLSPGASSLGLPAQRQSIPQTPKPGTGGVGTRPAPLPLRLPPAPLHPRTHGDDVAGLHVQAGQVVVVAVILDGPDLQRGRGVCGTESESQGRGAGRGLWGIWSKPCLRQDQPRPYIQHVYSTEDDRQP